MLVVLWLVCWCSLFDVGCLVFLACLLLFVVDVCCLFVYCVLFGVCCLFIVVRSLLVLG